VNLKSGFEILFPVLPRRGVSWRQLVNCLELVPAPPPNWSAERTGRHELRGLLATSI
jgi:hypothetical protein